MRVLGLVIIPYLVYPQGHCPPIYGTKCAAMYNLTGGALELSRNVIICHSAVPPAQAVCVKHGSGNLMHVCAYVM